jgi:hypothetical protein
MDTSAVDPNAQALAQIAHSLVGYLTVAGYGEMFAEAGFSDAVRLATEGASRDEPATAGDPGAERTLTALA